MSKTLRVLLALSAYGVAGVAVQAGLAGGDMTWLYFLVAMVWVDMAKKLADGGGL